MSLSQCGVAADGGIQTGRDVHQVFKRIPGSFRFDQVSDLTADIPVDRVFDDAEISADIFGQIHLVDKIEISQQEEDTFLELLRTPV